MKYLYSLIFFVCTSFATSSALANNCTYVDAYTVGGDASDLCHQAIGGTNCSATGGGYTGFISDDGQYKSGWARNCNMNSAFYPVTVYTFYNVATCPVGTADDGFGLCVEAVSCEDSVGNIQWFSSANQFETGNVCVGGCQVQSWNSALQNTDGTFDHSGAVTGMACGTEASLDAVLDEPTMTETPEGQTDCNGTGGIWSQDIAPDGTIFNYCVQPDSIPETHDLCGDPSSNCMINPQYYESSNNETHTTTVNQDGSTTTSITNNTSVVSDGSGVPDPTATSSARAGINCSTPPMSTGDAQLSAMLYQEWALHCKDRQDAAKFAAEFPAALEAEALAQESALDGLIETTEIGLDTEINAVFATADQFGSVGSCPPDEQLNLSVGSFTWSYQLLCDQASAINALVMFLAYVMAATILYKGVS